MRTTPYERILHAEIARLRCRVEELQDRLDLSHYYVVRDGRLEEQRMTNLERKRFPDKTAALQVEIEFLKRDIQR